MIDQLEKEIEMVERHSDVLRAVMEHQPIGIVSLADETGYQKHKVRYSLRILEENGIIEPTSRGAVTTEATDEFVSTYGDGLEDVIDQLRHMQATSEMLTVEQ